MVTQYRVLLQIQIFYINLSFLSVIHYFELSYMQKYKKSYEEKTQLVLWRLYGSGGGDCRSFDTKLEPIAFGGAQAVKTNYNIYLDMQWHLLNSVMPMLLSEEFLC